MRLFRNLLLGLTLVLSGAMTAGAAPVHFVAELGKDVNVDDLEDNFVKAMRRMGSNCDHSDIDIKVLDYGQYKQFTNLINHFSSRPLEGSVTIVPSDFDDTKWKLRFADENTDIVSLAIDGTPEGLVFEGDDIGGKGDSKKPLWLRVAGEYNLSLPAEFVPSSYTIEAINLETGESEKILGKWPRQGRYCLIKIADNCVDDTQKLRDILQDKTKMAEPLRLSDVQEPVQLFHAAIGETEGVVGAIWANKTLRMSIPQPQGRDPKRVWIMFPVTHEEAQARIKTLKNADGSFKKGDEVAEIIQRQGVIQFPLLRGVHPFYNVEKGKNGWYEMPEDMAGNQEVYEAIWEFDNPDDPYWKGRDHRLYVFEFEYGGDTEVVSVTHPITAKKVRAVDEEFNVWNMRKQ